jgi:luciferase family oxidoreductase group 1
MTCDALNLSILEFGYTSRDGRMRSGLEFTLALARLADDLGYSRFWFTEHHDEDLQIASPEVVIATAAAKTRRIRVGSAGILLHYYSPQKVAETFHTLATLCPDRIDLGLARGIGASPDIAERLRDGAPKPADAEAAAALFDRKTRELIARLRQGHETQRKIESKAAVPPMPQIWLMGSGTGSAALAAKLGANLCMTLWYSMPREVDVRAVLQNYVDTFERGPDGPPATPGLSLSGICAETDAEAKKMLKAAKERCGDKLIVNFCGSPARCRETILELADRHGVNEVVIQGQHCGADRQLDMFGLLADAMLRPERPQRREPSLAQAV